MAQDSPRWPRVVLHADMDAFYAAIEQLDDPTLRGRPVLVGPRSDRGVVLTASYEARPFDVGSAQPMAQARRRCPHAVIVPPRFERYAEVSARVMRVFRDFSPIVEALSLDEAFLDMSGAERVLGPPERVGRRLKEAVRDATGLTVSVGISGTKYVAKVASGYEKPDGLTIVPPDRARSWLAPLPVASLWGAGPKTQAKLRSLGLETIGDVATSDPQWLGQALGAAGRHFHALAQADDPRPVVGSRAPRSIGYERTLERDLTTRAEIERELRAAADAVGRRLRAKRYLAGGVRVKLKRSDFSVLTRQRAIAHGTDRGEEIYRAAVSLLDQFAAIGPVRLVGIAAYALGQAAQQAQLGLLMDAGDVPRIADGVAHVAIAAAHSPERVGRLERTLDAVAERFGTQAIRRASDLVKPGSVVPAPDPDRDADSDPG